MMGRQFTEELFPMCESFAATQIAVGANISFQDERRRMEMRRARTIQASMRRSQWQRLFWSKLMLCWTSAALVLLTFVWHSRYTAPKPNASREIHVAGATWDDHHPRLRNNENGDLSHFRRVFLSKELVDNEYVSRRQKETSDQTPQVLEYVAPPYTLHSSRTMSNNFKEKQGLQQQYTSYDEPQPSPDDDGAEGPQKLGIFHPLSLEAPDSLHARQQQQQHLVQKNPAIYGWTPAAFPNPIYNPIRCAIAYLPQFMNHPPLPGGSQHDNGERTPQSATLIQQGTLIQQQQLGGNQHPLRLCDPDWVLGGMYLEQVAVAMNNFTKVFGREHYEQVMRQQEAATIAGVHAQAKHPSNEGLNTWVDLAIATARKMDLTAVLRDSTYYAYEDDDDMVNDAAQQFAHGLHASWWPSTATPNDDGSMPVFDEGLMEAEHGILIFLSVQDRVCFISTGPAISSILPWWRVDHVVTAMKPALRDRDYGTALLQALSHLSVMIRSGPPSMTDRLNDFTARFGVVILFAGFTFFFGAWGEYRDRRKRYQFAEERSQLKGVDREKACLLQQGYKTAQCPICLESFLSDKAACLSDRSDDGDDDNDVKTVLSDTDSFETKNGALENKLDSYGIPLLGPDGKRIKMLRCGHIFCETCWKAWVNSGCGNPCICPVCRQDIGKAPKYSSRRLHTGRTGTSRQPSQTPGSAAVAGATNSDGTTAATDVASSAAAANGSTGSAQGVGVVVASPRNAFWETHPSYDSVSQSRRSSPGDMSVNNLNSTSASLENADVGFDVDDGDASVASGERRPLLSRRFT